ncbi:MAG: GIY-YIG nuclease family protein [Candidatus Thorarchaeota archaeon]
MRGAYSLIIDLEKDLSFRLKSLGDLSFGKGTWVYIGSAMGNGSTNLENRIKRHFRSEKTIHWHIDHLLKSNSRICAAIWAESSTHIECDIAKGIEQMKNIFKGPKGFGASDCRKKCWTHLYHSKVEKGLEKKIQSVFTKLLLKPKISQDGHL